MAGFANDIVFANNGDFSIAGSNKGSLANGLLTNGQMWIGSTISNIGGTHINVGKLISPGGTITIGYSSPNITLESATPAFAYKLITASDSPYTVLPADFYISCDSSTGSITVLLPDAPMTYRQFIIKDFGGFANFFNIQVSTVSGIVTIDGQTIYSLVSNFAAINLLFNGTSYEIY